MLLKSRTNHLKTGLLALSFIIGFSYFQGLAAASYQVEILIFQNLNSKKALHNELWQATPAAPSLKGSVPLVPPEEGDTEQSYQELPQYRWKLQKEQKAMQQSPKFRILSHLAWYQPIVPTNQAKKVQITPSLAQEDMQLTGYLKVSGTRHFQARLDLLLTLPANEAGLDAHQVFHIPLKETQRIYLNKLSYFDGPVYGVLLKVTRIKVEKKT